MILECASFTWAPTCVPSCLYTKEKKDEQKLYRTPTESHCCSVACNQFELARYTRYTEARTTLNVVRAPIGKWPLKEATRVCSKEFHNC